MPKQIELMTTENKNGNLPMFIIEAFEIWKKIVIY